MQRAYTHPVSHLEAKDFQGLVDLAWEEDLPEGDITSESLFSSGDKAKAILLAKAEGILCGLGVIPPLLEKVEHSVEWRPLLSEGGELHPGLQIGELQGSLVGILKIERILLNFIQYLSGIATNAYQVTKKYPDLVILDTRKTLPGYRKLAKYAVYLGGGWNHRLHLSDMAMLKDNHVAKAGSIQKAVQQIRDLHPQKKVELEIDSLAQVRDAILAKPDIILLDNFTDKDTISAIEDLRKHAPDIKIECSGGITPEKLEFLSQWKGIGVSMGYLTHTVKFLDISLDML